MKGMTKPLPYKHKRYSWRIIYPTKDGRRTFKAFDSKDDADAYYHANAPASISIGIEAATLEDADRIDYLNARKNLEGIDVSVSVAAKDFAEAIKALNPYGISLKDAVDFYAEMHRQMKMSKSLQDAIDTYKDFLRDNGKSERYKESAQNYLNRFKSKLKAATIVSTITTRDIEVWLNSLTIFQQAKGGKVNTRRLVSAETKNSYRRSLSAFFAFCMRKGWIASNPVANISTVSVRRDEVAFYGLDEIKTILKASLSTADDIRAYLVIGAFAGVRRAEIERMMWRDINLDQKQIKLTAKITKTGTRRIVKITDNLLAWLTPIAANKKPDDPICNPAFWKRMSEFRTNNNLHWIENGLRHSCSTYYYAISENEYETAKQLGHTPEILKKHYDGLANKTDAEAYWNILPTNLNEN